MQKERKQEETRGKRGKGEKGKRGKGEKGKRGKGEKGKRGKGEKGKRGKREKRGIGGEKEKEKEGGKGGKEKREKWERKREEKRRNGEKKKEREKGRNGEKKKEREKGRKGEKKKIRTLVEQKADTLVLHDTLLHGETLLVVTTHDLEDVSLVLITEGVGGDLGGKALVIEEDTELLLVVELDALLGPSGGVGNVKLLGEKGDGGRKEGGGERR